MSHRNFVKILTYTWSKDSHGLFDYESAHLFTGKFKLTGQGQFYRNANEIHMTEGNNLNDQGENNKLAYLFDVQQDPLQKDRYYLSIKSHSEANSGLGIVVRGIKKEGQSTGYELKVGDNLKVGRVKFIVRETRDDKGNIDKLNTVQEINYHYKQKHTQEGETGSGMTCRICLMEDTYEDPIENTLLCPCKCRGSCEYVHLRCLKQWIDSKKSRIENSSNTCLAFNYKKLSCEICKENLPYSIKLNEHEVEIVEIKKPENTPYILIEKSENTKESRGLFLIKASEEDVKIGRGHTNSILVSDISVSRNHASIGYKDGKFSLFDKNSKFGTLVQVNQPIEITADKTIIQCGKTVIILSLKRETLINMPQAAEAMEVLESPGTPSTTNENDIEPKLSMTESERPKRRRGRPRKAERHEYNHIQIDADNSNIYDGSLEEGQALESKLIKGSRKIFKIIKADVVGSMKVDDELETVGSTGRRKGRKRN